MGPLRDNQLPAIAYALVSSIKDFGCNHTANGCVGKHPDIKRACCHHCASVRGYLGRDFEKQSHLFKSKVGFWRKNGCVLPRGNRSTVCLTYQCHKAQNTVEGKETALAMIAIRQIAVSLNEGHDNYALLRSSE